MKRIEENRFGMSRNEGDRILSRNLNWHEVKTERVYIQRILSFQDGEPSNELEKGKRQSAAVEVASLLNNRVLHCGNYTMLQYDRMRH